MRLQVVLHILTAENLFMVATIFLLIQLFSFHHPSSVPLNSEDTSLLDHTHMLSHVPLVPWCQLGHAGEEPSPSLLRCWNKSSPWSLVCSLCMGPPGHIPTRDLPIAHKGERQMLLSKKHTPIFTYLYLHLHTNFYWWTLPVCLKFSKLRGTFTSFSTVKQYPPRDCFWLYNRSDTSFQY